MSDKWQSGSTEYGILRKTKPVVQAPDKFDDLLVFGYACKIFRDNERAKQIDHGKHLISWMGDNSLKIDRYDVRATLSDISQYEAPPGGYGDRLSFLSPAEQRAEQLCEEERYYSLYNNDAEKETIDEEELKRLHKIHSSTYSQVPFDYNNATSTSQPEEVEKEEECDEVFVPSQNFYIPPEIELPETKKLHAIIEKTAKFIASQGPQMEILIKAKQSNNPQFEFLNQNNVLNKYYKYILNAIKEETYVTDEDTDSKESTEAKMPIALAAPTAVAAEKPTGILNVAIEYPVLTVPQLKYKPSADCSYTQLISKIKGVRFPHENQSTLDNITTVSSQSDNNGVQTPSLPRPLEIDNSSQSHQMSTTTLSSKQNTSGVAVKQISSGLMLAQCYNSESESESECDKDRTSSIFIKPEVPEIIDFPIPPAELQNIIDKTAGYVLKNGKQFEDILRTKQDARFSFLSENDEFYRYYIYKLQGFVNSDSSLLQKLSPDTKNKVSLAEIAMPTTRPSTSAVPTDRKYVHEPKSIASVSFSIKPKDDQTFALKPAIILEPSSDEEDSTKASSRSSSQPRTTSNYSELHKSDSIPTVTAAIDISKELLPGVTTNDKSYAIEQHSFNRFNSDLDANDSATIRDSILESNCLIDVRRETVKAEEKIKDRLAQIAKEKLGFVSKEKQLQLERKKRAMAFLNSLNSLKDGSSKKPTNNNHDSTKPSLSPPPTKHTPSSKRKIFESQQHSDSDSSIDSKVSVHSVKSGEKKRKLSSENDPNIKSKDIRSKSRSRCSKSPSPATYKKHKHKKSKHMKKKSSKKARSRSSSRSKSRDHRSHSRKHSSSSNRYS